MPRSPLGSQKTVGQKAAITEKKMAADLGGVRVPNSGAIDGLKGDVQAGDFLIDSKETGSRSLVVSGKMLSKISREARESGKQPALVLTMGQVPLGVSKQWALVPYKVFKDWINQ